jgi:hypothetical protein
MAAPPKDPCENPLLAPSGMLIGMRLRMLRRPGSGPVLLLRGGPRFRSRSCLRGWSCFRPRFRSWPRLRSRRRSGPWLRSRPLFWSGSGLLRARLLLRSRWSGLGFGSGFRSRLHCVCRSRFCGVGPRFRRISGPRLHCVCGRVCWSRAVVHDRPHHGGGGDAMICCHGSRCDKRLRPAVIDRGELSTVGRRFSLQLQLSAHWRGMWCAIGRYFCRDWA